MPILERFETNVIDRSPSVSPTLTRGISTCADHDTRSIVYGRPSIQEKLWMEANDRLNDWLRAPSSIDEDDLQSPSIAAIERAANLTTDLRESGFYPPQRIVSDGEGGIVFERSAGPVAETLRIGNDGSLEYFKFENSRLVKRIVK